jgi:hypothetical protein
MLNQQRVDHILRAAGVVTVCAHRVSYCRGVALRPPGNHDDLARRRLFAYDAPDAESIADQLDGALGQASPFDAEFGYYCDGVGPETAVLPDDWRDRAKLYSSPAANGVVALAPEPTMSLSRRR